MELPRRAFLRKLIDFKPDADANTVITLNAFQADYTRFVDKYNAGIIDLNLWNKLKTRAHKLFGKDCAER